MMMAQICSLDLWSSFTGLKANLFLSLPVSQQCVCDSKLWCHICIKWWHWMKSLFDCVFCALESKPSNILKVAFTVCCRPPKELELYRKYSHYTHWRLLCLLVINLIKCIKYVFVFYYGGYKLHDMLEWVCVFLYQSYWFTPVERPIKLILPPTGMEYCCSFWT